MLRFGGPPLGPVMIGVAETGDTVELPVDETSISVGGLTRSGKSVLLAGIIRQLALRRDTALLLADPKLVEFAGWYQRASSLALGVEAVREQCWWLVEEVMRRYATICDLGSHRVRRRVQVGPDMPHLVWIVDECAQVFAGRDGAKIVDPFAAVMSMCLAAKVTPILCTQRPDVDAIPGRIRANVVLSVGFATRDELHSRMVFGCGGVPAHEIPQAAKGVGYYISDADRSPRKFRSFLVADSEIEEVAARTAMLRVPLEHLGLPHRMLSPQLAALTKEK